MLLVSGVSQRRAAKILRINRKTVVRKFLFLSLHAAFELRAENLKLRAASEIQFDDLETFEHTKCKPLSVTIAVEKKTRRILGLEVSEMPANGRLAAKSRKKYGRRSDGRRKGRERLFAALADLVAPNPEIRSDQNPFYRGTVKKFFPGAFHRQFKGRAPADTGLGELKKGGFDPLFDLNHTCAMFRANVNRLFRKTWCTTKKSERLYAHLVLYAAFHNAELIERA
jgi:hypothetical protein